MEISVTKSKSSFVRIVETPAFLKRNCRVTTTCRECGLERKRKKREKKKKKTTEKS
jgi:hypothetical protein